MRILRKNTEKWYVEVFEYLCSLRSNEHLTQNFNDATLNGTPRRLIRKILRLGVFKAPYPYTWMNARIKYNKTVSNLRSPLRMTISLVLYGYGAPYRSFGNKLFWNTILRIRVSYRFMKIVLNENRPISGMRIRELYSLHLLKVALPEEIDVALRCTAKVYLAKQSYYEQDKFMTLMGNVLFVYSYNQKLYRYELRDYGVVCEFRNITHVADEHWFSYTSDL